VRGTQHDVPARADCWRCHIGEPGHILGFSAVQLAADAELSPAHLVERGLLSDAPARPIGLPSGTDAGPAARAQGWLHANCGHCHNDNGNAWSQTSMVLRLYVDEHDPDRTRLAQSTVGVPLEYFHAPGLTLRIAPGDPPHSAIFFRDSSRGSADQMPPLATEVVDPDGLARVQSWIESLPSR
jgi:hypothetical protein